MGEPFLGEVRAFAFNYQPEGWLLCDGQLLPISHNTPLFALLGSRYGGDGKTSFSLPNIAALESASDEGLAYYIAVQGIFPPR